MSNSNFSSLFSKILPIKTTRQPKVEAQKTEYLRKDLFLSRENQYLKILYRESINSRNNLQPHSFKEFHMTTRITPEKMPEIDNGNITLIKVENFESPKLLERSI